MSYVKPKEAAQFYNVSQKTLRLWETQNKIKAHKTKGGHRRYFIQNKTNLNLKWKDPAKSQEEAPYILYARVSSHKQKSDLQRQVLFLQERFQKYQNAQTITDIGSGLNNNRPGFKAILERLFKGTVKKVMVAYPDRWSRFGFDLFQWIFKIHGAQLLAVNNPPDTSAETELGEDILAIITHFTAKYHGSRKYHLLKKNPYLSDQSS